MFRARRIMRRRDYAATRGADRGQEQEAPEARAKAPAPVLDPGDQIKELAELREQGILTEEEFAAEKKKLLGT